MDEIQVYQGAPPPLALSEVKAQVNLIQQIMREVMHEGIDAHYAVIPGTAGKPSLLKAGAEKIIMTFRLVPEVDMQKIDLSNDHREYNVTVRLSTQNGIFLGNGVGSCTTMETKYRFRKANQTCPHCGRETIIKGKKEYGGGWICFQKQGGCGAKFNDDDPSIENQNMGRIEHENPADYYNTCLKMAKKRALVDACLTVTAASDIFTQDIEEEDLEPQSQRQEPTKTKAPITKPAERKQGTQEPLTVRGVIDDVTVKTGTGSKGQWTKFAVKINGAWFSTFDTKIGEIAELHKGYEVVASYTSDGRFSTIIELIPFNVEKTA